MRERPLLGGGPRATHRPDVPYALFIAGEWAPARNTFPAVDPSVGAPWAEIPAADAAQVEGAVVAARKAAAGWRRAGPAARQEALWRMADRIEADRDRWAALLATEGGRPVRESYLCDIPACVATLRLYSGLTRGHRGEQVPMEDPHAMAYTLREPLGVLAVRVPWTLPLVSLAGQVGPALAAGNTVVVRPDGAASATVLEFARAAGDLLPPGAVNVVTGAAPETDALLDGHGDVHRVVTPAGPGHRSGVMVVLPDADLDAAVADAVTALCTAGGEAGATPARLLVHESVHDEFAGRLAALLDAVVLGDPLDLATELGPLISAARRDEARTAVRRASAEGARVLAGGGTPALPPPLDGGYFFRPTLLAREEGAGAGASPLPGPAAVLEPFREERGVAERLNAEAPPAVRRGRAVGVWTGDLARAHALARDLEAGIVWINRWFDSPAGFQANEAPASGAGDELGERTLARYSTAKVVSADLGSRRPPLWGGGTAGN